MKTIGFLGVAHIHTPGFINRVNERGGELRVKAVWDTQPERANIAAEQLSCAAVADYRDIVNEAEIDAIIVCSETSLHLELVEATAAAGKDVFVEKPLGMGASDAYAMQRAVDAAGVIFQTGHFMRSMPVYRQLKAWIEAGTLGTITRIRHSNVHQGAIAAIFDSGRGPYLDWLWMTDPALSGCGGFGDLGAHSLDILMWLMGDVDSVTAQVDRLLGKYDCDEYGEGMLRFANGAIGTLAAGWVDVLRPQSILVSGTEGVAYVDDGKLFVQSANLPGTDGGEWTDLPEALPHAFDLFLDAIKGEDVALISAKEAADRSAVMEAFYQAAETNSWVKPRTS
ncbi:MAG: Gfo/Idh/MocA family oxidoreductase [Chloroflexota bacterium]|nr:Gfo/Idh/MocA family oxidoreductase [Chloroflexota bacterium]